MAESTKLGELLFHTTTKNLLVHLIQRGANVNVWDSGANTPLHWAVKQENFEKMQILVANGAKVNVHNNNILTPLHLIVVHYCGMSFSKKAIPFLLEHGADANLEDSDGRTPRALAAKLGLTIYDLLKPQD